MRVVIIGGTSFIGAALVEALQEHGHEVICVHRGQTLVDDLPPVERRTCDRRDPSELASVLADLVPEVVVDSCAYDKQGADALVSALPPTARAVVLSSMDVYRAYGAVLSGGVTDRLPLDEHSPLRSERYPYQGKPLPQASGILADTYEKIDVEEAVAQIGATVLRLPVVYGERDPLRREGFLLDRIAAGRQQIPVGSSTLLWTRCWVRDVARAVRCTVESELGQGEIYNIGEAKTGSVRQWMEQILEIAGAEVELVPVPDSLLPPDLGLTKTFQQHLLASSARFRSTFDWSDSPPDEALRASVSWHLEHSPRRGFDFSADDRALQISWSRGGDLLEGS